MSAQRQDRPPWQQDFIATFLHRDLRQFGLNMPAQTMQRFWRMTAHLHGQLFNASQIAASLVALSHTTVGLGVDAAYIVAPVAQGWPLKTDTAYPVKVVSVSELSAVF